MERPVAVLDADGGGLRLLAELNKRLPAEEYVYLADAGRGPYGRTPVAEARRWTEEGAYFLLRFDPKLLVVGSHTMGAVAGEHLRKSLPVPVFSPVGLLTREAVERGGAASLGVLPPGSSNHVQHRPGILEGPGSAVARGRVVALLASDTSLASGVYQEALAKAAVKGVLCPASELTEALAAGAVAAEEGVAQPAPSGRGASPARRGGGTNGRETPSATGESPRWRAGEQGPGRLGALLEKTLAPALEARPRVQAVLLGESALGLVAPLIRQFVGPEVPVIDVLARLAGEVERMLALTRTLRPPGGAGRRYFLASGDAERFAERGATLYGGPLGHVVMVSPQQFFAQRGA
jgi:glutamate racemase